MCGCDVYGVVDVPVTRGHHRLPRWTRCLAVVAQGRDTANDDSASLRAWQPVLGFTIYSDKVSIRQTPPMASYDVHDDDDVASIVWSIGILNWYTLRVRCLYSCFSLGVWIATRCGIHSSRFGYLAFIILLRGSRETRLLPESFTKVVFAVRCHNSL